VDNSPLNLVDFLGLREIEGIEITNEFCGCQSELKGRRSSAQKMQEEYRKAGTAFDGNGMPRYQTADEIEDAVHRSLASQGIGTRVAGTTDSEGHIDVPPEPGKCGRLTQKGTQIHERTHKWNLDDLRRKYSRISPVTGARIVYPIVQQIRESAHYWWLSEFEAYGSEIPFYDEVTAELDKICCSNTDTKKQ